MKNPFSAFSRRLLGIVLLIMLILSFSVNVMIYILITYLHPKLSGLASLSDKIPELAHAAQLARYVVTTPMWLSALCATGFFLVLGLFIWFFAKAGVKSIFTDLTRPDPKALEKEKSAQEKQRQQRLHDERMYLHLLSLLQRNGRFLDFLSEDLEQYPDEQIGAAVRGIHADCNAVLKKHLQPEPVMEQEEGEEVTISRGFNASAVSLVGNVSGQPPFSGVLRHRGWQVKKLEVPKFSGKTDTHILFPAEVEIQ